MAACGRESSKFFIALFWKSVNDVKFCQRLQHGLQRELMSSSVVYSGFSEYCRRPERPSRFILIVCHKGGDLDTVRLGERETGVCVK